VVMPRIGSIVRSALAFIVAAVLGLTTVPAASSPLPIAGVAMGEWTRSPGGTLHAVAVNPAGKIFVAGSVRTKAVYPGTHIHLEALTVAKYDPAGTLRWHRRWRPSGTWFAVGLAVAPAPRGGVYVSGEYGQYEGWAPVLRRYSASGELRWRRLLPAPLGRGSMVSIASDADGVVGAVVNSDTGGPTAEGHYFYAYDNSGHRAWRSEFRVPGIRGTMNGIRAIALDNESRIYVAGFVDQEPLDARFQDWDVVVQQLDRGGHRQWTWVRADPKVTDYDEAQAVAVGSGFVTVSGSLNDSTRGVVWALTTDGDRSWGRQWDGTYQTSAPAITVAPWGHVYAASDQTVPGSGGSTTTASLRGYGEDGTYLSSRAAGAYISGVAADDALYVTSGHTLQRWLP
jgi:hypothetical protein